MAKGRDTGVSQVTGFTAKISMGNGMQVRRLRGSDGFSFGYTLSYGFSYSFSYGFSFCCGYSVVVIPSIVFIFFSQYVVTLAAAVTVAVSVYL